MRKDIIDEFIKNGGKEEDTKSLIDVSNGLDFELRSVSVHVESGERKNTTYALITPKTKEKAIFIQYIASHKDNTSYTEVILADDRMSKMSVKTSTFPNKKILDYFKGFIKIPNDGLYIFAGYRNNELNILYYDEEYFTKQNNTRINRLLSNLTLEKINVEPTFKTCIEIDITTSPYEKINEIFKNHDIITQPIETVAKNTKKR